jgi:ABC-type molybdate transport system ATPase subunit
VIALDFVIEQGEFVLEVSQQLTGRITALFGPSGAGKTTTLEAIAGLRTPSRGSIAIDDHVLFSSATRIDVPVHKRHVGYVAQDVSLFPHLSVRRNVLYGRREGQRMSLAPVAAMLEIEPLLDRGVSQLSGGGGSASLAARIPPPRAPARRAAGCRRSRTAPSDSPGPSACAMSSASRSSTSRTHGRRCTPSPISS